MPKQKYTMPQSTAGLVRYFEESKDAIKIRPEHVIIICITIIVLELALKFMF
jgi:preprotein translocase subunit Sec61beta